MAAPETQFGRAGISAGSTYTPVTTTLSTPNMGTSGAGALWAGVGKTALDASQQVFNDVMASPLNPAVKAKLQESAMRAQSGIDYFNYSQSLPPAQRFLLGKETTEGYEQISPAESGAKVFPYFQPKLKSTEAPPAPAPPKTAPGTGKESEEKTDNKAQGDTTKKPDDTTKKPDSDVAQDPPDVTATTTTRPYLSASSESGPIPTEATGEPGYTSQPTSAYRAQYAAEHPMGAPKGTFLNPATGSYEPLQSAPPAPGPRPSG